MAQPACHTAVLVNSGEAGGKCCFFKQNKPLVLGCRSGRNRTQESTSLWIADSQVFATVLSSPHLPYCSRSIDTISSRNHLALHGFIPDAPNVMHAVYPRFTRMRWLQLGRHLLKQRSNKATNGVGRECDHLVTRVVVALHLDTDLMLAGTSARWLFQPANSY